MLPELSSLQLCVFHWFHGLYVFFPTVGFSRRICCGFNGNGVWVWIWLGFEGRCVGCEVLSRAVVYEEG